MVIGIYGNIGTGKSTIAEYLVKEYKFRHLNLDQIAKDLQNNNLQLIQELQELKKLDIDVLTADEKAVDKQKMKAVIFYDENLNKIVSKVIWKYVSAEVQKIIDENLDANLIVEAAILPVLELKKVDYYFYVKSSQQYYENLDEIKILNKIQNHYNRCQPKNFILKNNSSIEKLHHQVDQIMAEIGA